MDEFEEISRNPEGAQERVLRSILRENRNTEYGQDQGFRRINSIPKFQRAMPVVEYEDIESRIERMLQMLLQKLNQPDHPAHL